MCGIYGVLDLAGRPAPHEWLGPLGRATIHRGPDDEGRHVDGELAMGMRRLSIIDLAGGHQPLCNEDGTLWLVANGEIYNYRELNAGLMARGHRPRTGSDCETLLHLYEERELDFLADVNGMFAFALWDARRRRLVLGRDRLGIKPLYLHRDAQGRLLFASEAKAILASGAVAREADPDALSAYLSLGYVPGPLSLFRGVRKLPPATLLVAEDGGVRERTYWSLPAQSDEATTEAQWIEAVREKLGDAVRLQMVSDVPLGAFLSGGIDSSAVVGLMAGAAGRPVKTYAIGFSGGTAESMYNELPFAREVAQRFGTEHHEIVVKPEVATLLPQLVWHLDEPVADSAFITTYLVSEFARRDVAVILSGVGGDELFGGYRRYLGARYRAYLGRVPDGVRRAALAVSGRLPADRHSRLGNAVRLARGFLGSAALPFEERYRSYVEVFDPDAMAELLVEPGAAFDALGAAFMVAGRGDELSRMLAVDARTQLPDDLLLLTDRMSMAVSLECRVPFLDHTLVELAARIPERIKMRDGRLKHVLKEALAGLLPRDILERRKRGFGAPMGAWIKRELAPLLHHVLAPAAVARRGWFRPQAVAALIGAHAAGRVDGTDRLLALLNLELWARLHLDRESTADVADDLRERAA